MIIDTTYFRGPIQVQFAEGSTAATAVLAGYEYLEKQILRDALGVSLYELYVTGIAATTQKYEDIRDGTTYTIQDRNGEDITVRWNGLLNSDKVSLLSYFIYHKYIQDNISYNSVTGEVGQANQNSVLANVNKKAEWAYNEGVELYGKDLTLISGSNNFIRMRDDTMNYKPLITVEDYYRETLKGTLYNFIYFMNDQNGNDYYPNWEFTTKDKEFYGF